MRRSLVLASLVVAPAASVAQEQRCDCVANECRAPQPAVVTLAGHLVSGTGSDPSGRIELYVALETRRPVCVEVADPEHPPARIVTTGQRFQLTSPDPATLRRLRHMVGQAATLRGTLSMRRDGAHYTALVFEVRAIGLAPASSRG